MGDNQKLSL